MKPYNRNNRRPDRNNNRPQTFADIRPLANQAAVSAFTDSVLSIPCEKHSAAPGEPCYVIPPAEVEGRPGGPKHWYSTHTGRGLCGGRINAAKILHGGSLRRR